MAMRESSDSRYCAMCPAGLEGGATAYLVSGARRRGRRMEAARLLVCEACYERGLPDPHTGRIAPLSARRTDGVEWWGLAGHGPALPPGACAAGCGLVVVRRAEALMKKVTCSRACQASTTRIRNGGRGSGRPCMACGQPVTTGRADSASAAPPADRRHIAAGPLTGRRTPSRTC
ncbi:hypothetical protein GCM10010433_26880 [Streptomyces pulveraceus]